MLQDVISILGIANPQLSPNWQDGSLPTENVTSPMRLLSNAENGEWRAPAAGLLNQAFGARLAMPDGSVPAGNPWVLMLHSQVWLRLKRLYGVVIEGRATQTDRVERPVPRYFVWHGTTDLGGGPKAGPVNPGDGLSISGGSLSVHDDSGLPIDPLSVASNFTAIMTQFQAIISKDFLSNAPPAIASTQLGQLNAGLTGQEVRVRLVTFFRQPFTTGTARLTNLTAVDEPNGLYRLTNTAQAIAVATPPALPNETIVIGPATEGVAGVNFTPQPLGANAQLSVLKRDFLNLFADDIDLHLRGRETLVAPFAGTDFQITVRHNENISFLNNGNQVTAQAGQIISNFSTLSLAVSPVIASDFALAANPAASEWPQFPGSGDGSIPGRLTDPVISAHFLDAPGDRRDVFVQIQTSQLAPGTAMRIYNRKFLADAREGRGAGAGGVLNAGGICGFVLTNPFGLRANEVLPVNPLLQFDLAAVNRSGGKRFFGLLGGRTGAPQALNATEQALASAGTNGFNAVTERSISPSGILGLPTRPLNALGSITDPLSAVNVALSLGDETQPRVAPRLPLMSRNEMVVAGRDGAGNWSGLLSGLWLRKDSRSSFHRIGSPGSPGGEEFLGIGIQTNGGNLAFDLARAALRRTRGLATRLGELANNANWTPPNATPAGSFSAALLQNIAPGADSPNIKLIPEGVFNAMPGDWSSLVNWFGTQVPTLPVGDAQLRNAITNLAANPQGDLLYTEFRREALTSKFGRRDTLPVLTSAIKSARDLIYIETPAFSFTQYLAAEDNPDPAKDLVSLMANQLSTRSNLKILICVSKEVSVGKGYETFAARAYAQRLKALNKLKDAASDRVVLFHPTGFPGRPIRLMHQLVIVDDVWLLAGSGSFTRRGLLFDGGLDMVLFDRNIEAGRSRAIRTLRRQLMEQHLGAVPLPGSPPAAFPHASTTRTADLNESFQAFQELLEQGGAGLIQPVFDGTVTGQTPIPPASFPHRDLAEPDGLHFPDTLAALLQLFVGLGEADA